MSKWWTWLGIGAAVVVFALITLPSLGIGVGQILGLLLVLACPLMHFLGGHGHHGHGQAGPPAAAREGQDARDDRVHG